MNFEELLEYLDLEDPSEFIYFEAMADLIESDDPIEQEAVYALFDGADKEMVAELIDDYFEEILEGLPEGSSSIYDLLHQIKLSLMGMAMNSADESDLRRFTDGFCRFRNWYVEESDVELAPEDGGPSVHQSVRDAITTARIENLGGAAYSYDFDYALDYPLDSYEVSLASLVAAEGPEAEEPLIVSADTVYDDEESNEYLN